MVKCCVPMCYNASYRKTPEIALHRFPKDEYLRKAWLKNINRKDWQPSSFSVVCSEHFEKNLVIRDGVRIVLAAGAIPTIFGDFKSLAENKENEALSPESAPMGRKRTATGNIILHDVKNAILGVHNTNWLGTQIVEPSTSTAPQTPAVHLELAGISSKPEMLIVQPRLSCSQQYFKTVGDFQVQNPLPAAATHMSVVQPTTFGTPDVHLDTAIVHTTPQMQMVQSSSPIARGTGCCCSSALELRKVKKKLVSKNKSLRAIREKTRRLNKKVDKFSDVITKLKGKVQDDDLSILKNIPVSNKDFFSRFIKKANNLKLEKSYSSELRSFALQLNFYSPRSYNFLRQTFNGILPHPVTISRWYKKVNAEPGFTTESFKLLAELSKKSPQKTFVNLSLDEMSIRKELVWDGSKFVGEVDTGTEVKDDSFPLASLALVLFVTAINGVWKLPIAFFFITSMTGEQRANFVKMAVQLLSEVNVYVSGLTFDGAAANIGMATRLGCSFDLGNLKPYFMFNNQKIHVFWDPCHMLKLIRNTFGDFKTIIDNEGLHINFEIINQLMLLQQYKGLHLGNKLRQAHVLYSKQKMKVRLAAQLLSKSVATAIHFARETLNVPEFKDSYATEKFITLVNDCFDILNSRSLRPPGFKKALCEANIVMTTEFVNKAIDYLKCLKFTNNQLVVLSARKTGFVGFIVGLTSALNMYQELVRKERLLFLPIYKISQDFLEMFFGKIRARGGFNDNPNVVQFKLAYKKNLIMSEISLNNSGLYTDHISILNTPSTSNVQKLNCTTPNFKFYSDCVADTADSKYNEEFINEMLNRPLDDFTCHVIVYIAGFIARKILKSVKCNLCHLLVIGDKENFLFSLINVKDRGGLTYPSEGVIKIVTKCEKYFKIADNVTANYITKSWEHGDYFNLFHPGSGDNEHDAEHLYLIVKVIVSYYVNLRNKHIAKEMQSNVSKRNFLKKIILFENK